MGERFAGLVQRAARPGEPERYDAALFHRLLDQLTPPAAGVLAAFLDDRPRPAVQVLSRTRFGEVEFAVSAGLGRSGAGAQTQVTTYLVHLMALGLLEVGPPVHDPGAYLALESGLALRATRRDAQDLAGNATLRRCSVQLTGLGRAFLNEVTDT